MAKWFKTRAWSGIGGKRRKVEYSVSKRNDAGLGMGWKVSVRKGIGKNRRAAKGGQTGRAMNVQKV